MKTYNVCLENLETYFTEVEAESQEEAEELALQKWMDGDLHCLQSEQKCSSTVIGEEDDLPEEFPEGQSPTDICIAFAMENFRKYSTVFLQAEYEKLVQQLTFKSEDLFQSLFDDEVWNEYEKLTIAAFEAEPCDVDYCYWALQKLGVKI